MKLDKILFLLFIIINVCVYSQTINNDRDLAIFIQKSINYPVECRENGVEDIVVVKFVIINSKIDSIKVIKGSQKPLIKESIRIVNLFTGKIDTSYVGLLRNKNHFTVPFSYKIAGLNEEKFNFEAGRTFFEVGNFLYSEGNYKTAIQFYRGAFTLNPNEKDALYNLIISSIKANYYTNLCSDIEMLIKHEEDEGIKLKAKYCKK